MDGAAAAVALRPAAEDVKERNPEHVAFSIRDSRPPFAKRMPAAESSDMLAGFLEEGECVGF
jgi:hypothetical protein